MDSLDFYQEEPVEDIIRESVSAPDSDLLVFLMGPYRLLDPSYLYPEGSYSLPSDPLAPGEDEPQPDLIESTLRKIGKQVSEQTPATVFIASDVEIPTRREVEEKQLNEPGMPVIDQSIACARASAGSAFAFTKAGLTTGVGAEAGAIPEHFDLRDGDSASRNPRTFCILAEGKLKEDGTYKPTFSSASIDEMDDAYDLRFRYFESREELVKKAVMFIESYLVPLYAED